MELDLIEQQGVRLAIEGCGHGTLHAIYASVTEACKQKGWPGVDLLIIGGDFQAVRNAYDLNCVSMPAKYRSMCDFHEYYSGKRTAPYLTVFVGGNHEASNYLFELYYGGWVARKIYYMGAANVLRLGHLRIAALSGIWKGYNYRKPHHERLPYNENDIKSIYHVRELDVRKLLQIRSQVDIGISHDWPKGVEWNGNWKQLFRFKKHFEDDARSGQLGSVAAKYAMDSLRPEYWFSAHLHCKYAATVDHDKLDNTQQPEASASNNDATVKNTNEIDLDDDSPIHDPADGAAAKNVNKVELDIDEGQSAPGLRINGQTVTNADELDLELEDDDSGIASVAPSQGLDGIKVPMAGGFASTALTQSTEHARAALPEAFRRPAAPAPVVHPPGIANKTTNFLALDKCLPGRHFLQLLPIPCETDVDRLRPLRLCYDPEWLAITRDFAMKEPLELGDADAYVPRAKSQAEYATSINETQHWIEQNISDADMDVPENFEVSAPVFDGGDWNTSQYAQVMEYPNAQTTQFCKLLQIPNIFEISEEEKAKRVHAGPKPVPQAEHFGRGRGRGGFGHRGRAGGGRSRGRGGRGRSRGQ